MTTEAAPLLTAELAAYHLSDAFNPWTEKGVEFVQAERALADGCTACVDAIELKRLKRIDQAYPEVSAFYMKHAVGQKLAPSCFCCGQLSDERAVTHAELPDVFVCKTCKDATECVRVMSEDECRAEFEAWFFAHTDKTPTRYECWLASRRAMGAVR